MSYTNLKIKDCCIKCGSCLGCRYDFLTSNEDGSVSVRTGTELSESSPEYKELKEICPVGAFELTEAAGTQNTIKNLLKELQTSSLLSVPSAKDLKFDPQYIPLPSASGEHRYNYSSENAANRAALSEFERAMYSRIDVILLNLITEYRVNKIKPYYTDSIENGSIYAANNKKISDLLSDINRLSGNKFPVGFENINIFPSNELDWKMLNKGQLISDEMVSWIKDEFSYPSYDYEFKWDTDYMEVMAGESLFGKTKYKDMYCYRNLRNAFMELSKDLINACGYASSSIENKTLESVTWLVNKYNEEVQHFIDEKIRQIIGNINGLSIDDVLENKKTQNNMKEKNADKPVPPIVNYKSSISAELADELRNKRYVELKDYIVWTEWNYSNYLKNQHVYNEFFKNKKTKDITKRLKVWNKTNNEYFSLEHPSYAIFSISELISFENKILISDCGGMKFWVDIENNGEMERYRESIHIDTNFCTSVDGIYCAWDKIHDFKNNKIIDLKLVNGAQQPYLYTSGKVFYIVKKLRESSSVYVYDILSQRNMKLYDFKTDDPFQPQMAYFGDELYISYGYRTKKVIGIKRNGASKTYLETNTTALFMRYDTAMWNKSPYLVFEADKDIYILDMSSSILTEHKNCNMFTCSKVIGNFLYISEPKSCKRFRIDLTKKWCPIEVSL